MISNTKIKKKIKFIKTKLYQRCYQYVCKDDFVFTIVDTNKDLTSKELKNELLPKIKKYLSTKGLEE